MSFKRILVLLLSVPFAFSAHGFDPFTVAAVVGSAANTVSTVVSAAAEVGETAGAASELLSEFADAPQMSEEGRRTLQMVQEAEALGAEMGYTADQVSSLTGYQDVSQLKATLNVFTKIVRTGKQVYRLALKLQDKAHVAAIEVAKQAEIQTQLQKALLEQGRQQQLQRTLERLREEKRLRDAQRNYLAELKKIGGPQMGLPNFPNPKGIVESGLALARRLSAYLVALIGALFIVRVVINQFAFEAAEKYEELLLDTMWALILFAAIPLMLQWSFAIGQELADSIKHLPVPESKDVKRSLLTPLSEGVGGFVLIFLVWFRAILLFLSDAIVQVLIGFFVAVFPIIVFVSRMLKMRAALSGLIAMLITLALWPLLWNITTRFALDSFGSIGKELTVGGVISGIVVLLTNLLMPMWVKGMLTGTAPNQAFGQTALLARGAVGDTATKGATLVASGAAKYFKGGN